MFETAKSTISGSGNCAVCRRRAERIYCTYHDKAYSQIQLGLKAWQEAFENLTWERYLERILELGETGEWARDVARHQLSATKGNVPVSE